MDHFQFFFQLHLDDFLMEEDQYVHQIAKIPHRVDQ